MKIYKPTLNLLEQFTESYIGKTGEYTHIIKRQNDNITIDNICVKTYKQGINIFCILYGEPFYINDNEKIYVNSIIRTIQIERGQYANNYVYANTLNMSRGKRYITKLVNKLNIIQYLTRSTFLPSIFSTITQQINRDTATDNLVLLQKLLMTEPIKNILHVSYKNKCVTLDGIKQTIYKDYLKMQINNKTKNIKYKYIKLYDSYDYQHKLILPPVSGTYIMSINTIFTPVRENVYANTLGTGGVLYPVIDPKLDKIIVDNINTSIVAIINEKSIC